MFCPKCGKEIQGGASYCPGCGNPVGCGADVAERRDTGMQTAVRKKNRITPWIVFGIIMFIVVVVVVTVAVYGSPQRKYNRQISLAERYLNDLDYDKAIAAYQAAIRMDPKSAEAYLGLAEAYIGLGDSDKALDVLKEGYEQTWGGSIDRKMTDLANNEDRENMSVDKENSSLIKEDHTDEKETGEEETVNGLTFADIPSCFTYWTYTMGSIGTVIEIESDGSFEGEYSAYINMETGPGYEDGTFYSNEFKGKLSQPVQIDEYTYSIKLEYISRESESERIENGSRYVVEEPEGICSDSDLLLYLPGTPIAHMEEDMQFWINGVGNVGRSGDLQGGVEVLPAGNYGLYQPGNWCGFIGVKLDETEIDEATDTFSLFKSLPDEFYYGTGDGYLYTIIDIYDDGSFSGEYSEQTFDRDDDYPNGSCLYCSFSGYFSEMSRIDDTSYSLIIQDISIEDKGMFYEDGCKYSGGNPYGINSGDQIIIYMPRTVLDDKSEAFWSGSNLYKLNEEGILPYNCFAFHNINQDVVFWGYTE